MTAGSRTLLVQACELDQGMILSGDGSRVESAAELRDGRISIETWMDASGGVAPQE